jgi:UDP-2,3-diacylglucosamine pyrophosphatase LpxH
MAIREKLLKKSAAEAELQRSRDQVTALQKIIDRQAAELEAARAPKFRLPVGGGKQSKSGRGAFCRVVVPDSHGCFIDGPALSAFLGDLAAIKPAEIIMLGDHLDCGGFLAQHQTIGFVAESDYSYAEDVEACNQFLDAIQKRAPKATIEYLFGNHEARVERWVITQTLRNKRDGEFLMKTFAAENSLSLERRGIQFFKQGVFYDGLPLPATIRRGHCHFTHGIYTSSNAAAAHLRKYGGNVVFGHTHRADSYTIRTVKAGVIGAWNPGCLCQLQRLWNHTALTDWSHGYGLQVVQGDEFLHINVPIIDGKSYLQPLAATLKGK